MHRFVWLRSLSARVSPRCWALQLASGNLFPHADVGDTNDALTTTMSVQISRLITLAVRVLQTPRYAKGVGGQAGGVEGLATGPLGTATDGELTRVELAPHHARGCSPEVPVLQPLWPRRVLPKHAAELIAGPDYPAWSAGSRCPCSHVVLSATRLQW